MSRNRIIFAILLAIGIGICLTVQTQTIAKSAEKVGPTVGTDDSRTDLPKRGSLASILNPDGSIGRDRPGNYDARGYSIAPGVDGAPRFVEALTPNSCGDGWDDRFGGMNGLNGQVFAIAVSSTGDVYVGGRFTQAGGVAANHIAMWNGSSWSALGSGTNDEVYAIAVQGSKVYVGGKFTQAGGQTVNRIAKWDGSSWSALSFGMNGYVYALAVVGNSSADEEQFYAGGDFTTAGSVAANRVALWDGTGWSALGPGVGSSLNDVVYALLSPPGTSGVFVGGRFTTAGGNTVNNIAEYRSLGWYDGVPGVTGTVEDIAISSDGYVMMGGNFTTADGDRNVAFLYFDTFNNGYRWGRVLRDSTQLDNTVYDVEVDGVFDRGSLPAAQNFKGFIGGIFSSPGNRVAQINRIDPVEMGTGISGEGTHVSALSRSASSREVVYVGGGFSQAGCRPSSNFGIYFRNRWVGGEFSTDWHTPGNWSEGTVPVHNTTIGSSPYDASISTGSPTLRTLRIENSRTLTIQSGATLTIFRNLNISDGTVNGQGTLDIYVADPKAIYGGDSTHFISSRLGREITAGASWRFPVGQGGYAPVSFTNVSGGGKVYVTPHSGPHPLAYPALPSNRLQRWWILEKNPLTVTQTTATFQYNDSDVVGVEASYVAYRISSGGVATPVATTLDPVNNTATVTVGGFSVSDWTLAEGPRPTVTTQLGSAINQSQVRLNGTVSTYGTSVTGWFRFYGSTNPGTCREDIGERTPFASVTASPTPVAFDTTRGGLAPATTYYYCAFASNASGESNGMVASVTTEAPTAPTVTTGEPTSVTTSSATLHGIATPNGAQTTGWFRYSATDPGTCSDMFGTRTPPTGGTNLGSGTVPVNYSETVSGLLPSTLYYFCPIAENSIGKTYGPVVTFLTKGVRVVDNPSDEVVLGACTSAPGDCTLRGAVMGLNPGDEVRFLSPLFDSPQTIDLVQGTIVVMHPTNIIGPGAHLLTVTGGSIFTILDGPPESPTALTISGTRLSNGVTGGIRFQGGQSGKSLTATAMIFDGHTGEGAVVVSPGSQGTFVNSTFRNNTAFPLRGGAITGQANSILTIIGCTFHENFGSETIRAFATTVENSTIDHNSGRGLFVENSGFITSSTITVNGGGGVYAGGTGAIVRNSIIATNNNFAGDVEGIYTSEGYNFIGDPQSVLAFNQLGDQVGSSGAPLDPMLGPLFDNGGTTFTRVPVVGSPVIDRGNSFNSNADQRGFTRPVDIASFPNAGDGADIGAFEVQAPTAASVAVSGRIMTSSGTGIARARVTMTDMAGQTRTVLTSSFGYYRFEGVQAGGTYIIMVNAKGHQFTEQVVSVLDELSDVNFIAEEGPDSDR